MGLPVAQAQQQLPSAPSAQQFPQRAPVNAGIDREAFTFIRYDLRINLTPEQQALVASGTITLRNDSQQAQTHALLQISSSLDWDEIQVGGKPAEYTTHEFVTDIDHTGSLSEAAVNLSEPIAPGATVNLQIKYSGKIVRDAARLEQIGTPTAVAMAT